MIPEFITLCVAVVALTVLAVWLLSGRAALEVERDEARSERDIAIGERDAARTCRDAAKKERDRAVSALEALRTATRSDVANAAMLARLVIEQVGREHVEPDPAAEIRRAKVTSLTDYGSRP